MFALFKAGSVTSRKFNLKEDFGSSHACPGLCFHTYRPSEMTYFKGLVFHFHDELLLLFLPSTSVLKLGLDAVDLHLILHNCTARG